MASIRFQSSVEPMLTLQRELERFLGHPAISLGLSGQGAFPPINVFDDGEGVVIIAELPGLNPGDINISTQGRTLTLSSERKPVEAKDPAAYHRRERAFGAFSRSIQLPEDLDAQKAAAKYEAGLLTVRVPKAESAKPRKISVQGG